MRFLVCAVLLINSVGPVASFATGQQPQPNGGQEGVQQQTYQNMSVGQRAAATRAFLGLGAEPDKAAAERGEPLFSRNCAFCHGQNARGATGPSLITSDTVLADDHGEHLLPFLKRGTPDKGMPAFATMSDRELTDITEYLHLQVEDVANRGAYQVLNILVGDAVKGRTYLDAHCMSCHTDETFAHIASKFRSPEQLQRNWIWPAHSASMTVQARTANGTLAGRVVKLSDFQVTLVNSSGVTRTIDRVANVEIRLADPLAPHQQIVMNLTNEDMHNVTAYLETQK